MLSKPLITTFPSVVPKLKFHIRQRFNGDLKCKVKCKGIRRIFLENVGISGSSIFCARVAAELQYWRLSRDILAEFDRTAAGPPFHCCIVGEIL